MDPNSPLAAWETFFFLVGSSAAGLTGLQFVVIALIAESKRRATDREIDAFTTPTIVHFGGVLLLSALVSAPWHGLSRVAVIIGACGLAGIAYTLIIVRRARSQTTYQVVFSDWLWHVTLPLIAYTALVIAAALLPSHAERVPFSSSAPSRYCSCSSVFITPGTLSPTSPLSTRKSHERLKRRPEWTTRHLPAETQRPTLNNHTPAKSPNASSEVESNHSRSR